MLKYRLYVVMRFDEQIEMLIRLNELIRRKSTGSPDELSKKLGISRRHVFRLIDAMRCIGIPVDYSKTRRTYFYFESGNLVVMKWTPDIKSDDEKIIKNGKATYSNK